MGVKLLGGAVSRDGSFIEGLAMKKAAKAVELMHLLPQLGDPQSELLLLRSCMGIAKLFFGLRTCQPVHMEGRRFGLTKSYEGRLRTLWCVGVLSLGTFNGGLLLYPSGSEVWGCTRQSRPLHMLLWPPGPNLGCYKIISCETVASVV